MGAETEGEEGTIGKPPPRACRREIPAYASSSISGSVKIENAVDSATPREASELSQWYISLCMAVVAAQGMAVQMYSTLTTAAGRPVKRSSSTAAGKIISRSAHASSSFQSCRCAKRR